MPRSDEAEAFFHAVYAAVQEIPYGKVSSYGHVAMLVGICMKHLPVAPTARFNSQNVPWQRVINARGFISPRSRPSGAQDQAAALHAEGVDVATGALGELMVDLARYGWFPRLLPSEASQDRDEHPDPAHE